MIHMAVCRYWAAYLSADVGAGVMRINAEMALVPRFPGDAAPPDLQLVTHPYTPGDLASDRAARGEAPQQYPALYVLPDGPIPAEGEISPGDHRDCVPSIATKYIVAKNDYGQAQQWAAYAMKALERCAYQFFYDDAAGRAARGDGHASGIEVLQCGYDDHDFGHRVGMAYGPWKEEIGMAMTAQVFTLMMVVRDHNP